MISFFKKLFGGQTQEINEEEKLIDTLKKDHKKLIDIYTNIDKAITKNDFDITKKLVKQFISEYNKHILLEDTKLYVSLKDKYKEQKSILKTIKNIEKDMNSITRSIIFFEKKYQLINSKNKDEFIADFHEIGAVLTQRVELEEERLYSLL